MELEWSTEQDWLDAQNSDGVEIVDDSIQLAPAVIDDPELYSFGAGEDNWTEGPGTGTRSVTKESDHLNLFAEGTGADISFVTVEPIDASEWDEIEVTWRNNGDDEDNVGSRIAVHGDDDASLTDIEQVITRSGNFSTRTDTGALSDWDGFVYVYIYALAQDFKNPYESDLSVDELMLSSGMVTS